MAKMIIGFLVLFVLLFAAFQAFSDASGRGRFQLIKSLGYAMVLTVVTLLIISTIVVLF